MRVRVIAVAVVAVVAAVLVGVVTAKTVHVEWDGGAAGGDGSLSDPYGTAEQVADDMSATAAPELFSVSICEGCELMVDTVLEANADAEYLRAVGATGTGTVVVVSGGGLRVSNPNSLRLTGLAVRAPDLADRPVVYGNWSVITLEDLAVDVVGAVGSFGGLVGADGGSVSLRRVTVAAASAVYGGVVAVTGGCSVRLEDVTIGTVSASLGGVVFLHESTLVALDVSVGGGSAVEGVFAFIADSPGGTRAFVTRVTVGGTVVRGGPYVAYATLASGVGSECGLGPANGRFAVYGGESTYADACEIVCDGGFSVRNGGCVANADACGSLPASSEETVASDGSCTWVCVEGHYRRTVAGEDECDECRRECTVGEREVVACSQSTDRVCESCGVLPVNAGYSVGGSCAWICAEGGYYNGTACETGSSRMVALERLDIHVSVVVGQGLVVEGGAPVASDGGLWCVGVPCFVVEAGGVLELGSGVRMSADVVGGEEDSVWLSSGWAVVVGAGGELKAVGAVFSVGLLSAECSGGWYDAERGAVRLHAVWCGGGTVCRFEDVVVGDDVLRAPDGAVEGTCEVDIELVAVDAEGSELDVDVEGVDGLFSREGVAEGLSMAVGITTVLFCHLGGVGGVCVVCPSGAATSASGCAPCAAGEAYTGVGGVCIPCSVCDASVGEGQVEACTVLSDSVCASCVAGVTYIGVSGVCGLCSVCDASVGEEQVGVCTVLSDTVCASCVAGVTYIGVNGVCEPCSVCDTSVGEEQVGACTVLLDAVCASCVAGVTYIGMNGACEPCSVCDASVGEEQVGACTVLLDAVCRSCVAGVTYIGMNGACEPCSVCDASVGEEQVEACTVLSDTVCASCVAGVTYIGMNGACEPCSVCDASVGEEQVGACTVLLDAVCRSCVAGVTYIGMNGACEPCSVCDASVGEEQVEACTVLSDTVCASCVAGVTYIGMNGVCMPCSSSIPNLGWEEVTGCTVLMDSVYGCLPGLTLMGGGSCERDLSTGVVPAVSVERVEDLCVTLRGGGSGGVLTGGSLTVAGVGLGVYDVVRFDGDTDLSATSIGTGASDVPAVVIVNGNGMVPSGSVVRPPVRKLFMVYCADSMTVNGTVSMRARGARHTSLAPVDLPLAAGMYGGVSNPYVPAEGGAGAATYYQIGGRGTSVANSGAFGTGGGSGGGGGGGSRSTGTLRPLGVRPEPVLVVELVVVRVLTTVRQERFQFQLRVGGREGVILIIFSRRVGELATLRAHRRAGGASHRQGQLGLLWCLCGGNYQALECLSQLERVRGLRHIVLPLAVAGREEEAQSRYSTRQLARRSRRVMSRVGQRGVSRLFTGELVVTEGVVVAAYSRIMRGVSE